MCSTSAETEEKPLPEVSLDEVLKNHIVKYIIESDFAAEQLIPVRRKELWKDVLRCINAPGFIADHGLRIRYVGEEAVDAGGPLR